MAPEILPGRRGPTRVMAGRTKARDPTSASAEQDASEMLTASGAEIVKPRTLTRPRTPA